MFFHAAILPNVVLTVYLPQMDTDTDAVAGIGVILYSSRSYWACAGSRLPSAAADVFAQSGPAFQMAY